MQHLATRSGLLRPWNAQSSLGRLMVSASSKYDAAIFGATAS